MIGAPVAAVQRAVADHYMLPVRLMSAQDRSLAAVRARQVAVFLSRAILGKGVCEIGRRFNRDHSTIAQAIRRVPELMVTDSDLRMDVAILSEKLAGYAVDNPFKEQLITAHALSRGKEYSMNGQQELAAA